jgi:hypothetical protein
MVAGWKINRDSKINQVLRRDVREYRKMGQRKKAGIN